MGQAQKKFSIRIPLNTVSEHSISNPTDYCYLVNNDVKQGPYSKAEVENLIAENPHLTAHLIIVDYGPEGEAPATVNIQSITGDVYFLENGQKQGPFSMEDIANKLDNKEIMFTDFISLDGGRQWLKISEHDQFNRRRISREDNLPNKPGDDLFVQNETPTTVDNEEEDALIGLAYIGKNGDKQPDKILNASEKSYLEKNLKGVNWSKILTIFFALAITLFLVLGIKFYFENKEPTTPAGPKTKKVVPAKNFKNKRPTVKKPVKKAKNLKANRKTSGYKKPKAKPYKNKNFKNSDAYKANKKREARRRLQQNRQADNYNENYDQDDPIELDPIQNSLEDDVVNPKGEKIEELLVDDEFINEINDAVEEELFKEEIDF